MPTAGSTPIPTYQVGDVWLGLWHTGDHQPHGLHLCGLVHSSLRRNRGDICHHREQASNHTLYAQWTANNYTVTFDANGGGTPIRPPSL